MGRASSSGERTFQVRPPGVGRARISDEPGAVWNRGAATAFGCSRDRLLKAVSFRAAAVSSFPGQNLRRLGNPWSRPRTCRWPARPNKNRREPS